MRVVLAIKKSYQDPPDVPCRMATNIMFAFFCGAGGQCSQFLKVHLEGLAS